MIKRLSLYMSACCLATTLLFISFIFPSALKGQQRSVVAPGAKLKLVSDQFSFTEGPAADKNGNIFFTDQPNNQIWEYSTDGKLSLYMDDAGRSNGLYFDHKGNLVAAADKKDELWSISPDKNVTVLVKNFQGHRLNGPNDLWIDPEGGIYFTDPYYQRDYWKRTEPDIKKQRVYYLSPDKQHISVVAGQLAQPNGIIGTPDGKTLYIADIGDHKTYAYKIKEDGRLTDKTLFAQMGSDGVTLDTLGNLYLTGKNVVVFNKDGTKIEEIAVPHQPANVTFGGADRKTLFITARPAVYTLKMKVKGAQ